MRKGTIFGRDCCMQGSPYTLLVFKEEFDEDLAAFMDEQLTRFRDENIFDIENYLRIAWAMCRTFDYNIPNYERWLEEFDDSVFDIRKGQDAFVVIFSAIEAELFCEKTDE